MKKNVENKQSYENYLTKENLSRKVFVHKFDKDKQEIVLMGDEHIGSKFYDESTHKQILDYCYKNLIPIILMGDEMETSTKTSIGAGIHEQNEIVQEQLDHCVDLFTPLSEKGLILGNHIGNHEMRVYNHSGTNLSKILSQILNINYLGVGAAHIIRVGNQSYTLYTTHGNSGARLPHTKIANIIKANQMIESEIYAQGHVHQLSHHVQNFYKINKSNRTVEEAQKHYILTGSYLKHWGSYAHTNNMEPSRIGSPKLKLSGLEHQIRVSL